MRVKSPVFGHFLVSMPYVNYGGPLGEEEAAGRLAVAAPDDDAWSWGPKLWRELPVPVATVPGPRIVRHIP